jgi:hypothetical protein
MKHIIEILKENGFEQMFPFVEAFRKDNIHVNVFYQVNDRKDKLEDAICYPLGIKVTKFNLPKAEIKIFKSQENALKYIFE